MAQSPHRAWVFTWNNPPADAYELLSAQRHLINSINVGREVGESGTPHLQGHAVFKNPLRLSAILRHLPHGIHWEVRMGTEKQAVDYTMKEGDPDRLDWDDRSQGARTDIRAMSALVAQAPRNAVRAVASQMPDMFVKYHHGVSALARALLPQSALRTERTCTWYYGPSGTGKTHTAVTEATALAGGDDTNVFIWNTQNFKFAGTYSGQQFVVIDELRADWAGFTYARLLTLLDVYRTEVEVKGGQLDWCATHVWITSPMHPDQLCPIEELRVNTLAQVQLARRLGGGIHHFTEVYGAPDPAPPALAESCCLGTPPLEIPGFVDYQSDPESRLPHQPRRHGRLADAVAAITFSDSD